MVVMANRQPRENLLTIVAIILAKDGKVDKLKSELERRVSISRREPGCRRYDLHVDNVTPGKFMTYETWVTKEHWQRHMQTDYMKELILMSDDLMEDLELLEMTQM
jgi:quinol monooxygenase YgiN|mmetsp:Transcript_30868/g.55254  ORF Transcript_30868/g.55254 Transcript_30868/m.55254 type:complete len:106 (-) Transcript_30868:133-450(-)